MSEDDRPDTVENGASSQPAQGATPPEGAVRPDVVSPPDGMRLFMHILANTMIANVTTSFLWFALVFWVYLETRSVLATGIIGGAYMLLIAFFAMLFGTLVDRHRKHAVMVGSSVLTLGSFLVAGVFYLLQPESTLVDLVDVKGCSLVLTTGGTGPAPRDVTPEATLAVADKVMPGFGEQMRAVSLKYVPTAILSRQVAVIRKNALIIFMSVELQLNAVNLSLVAFSRMHNELDGQVLAFFSMVVAAAEVVVGLAIIVTVYRRRRSASVDDLTVLRG